MTGDTPVPLRFTLSEFAGSLGDFGTIIPLILAIALVSDVNPRYILLFFGIWFILTGLYYRLPIPLEPMKAIAVIVIAGGIGSTEIAAAGLILGVLFLLLGYGRSFEFIGKWVPESVVRGIQLGLALLLFKASLDFVIKDSFFFVLGIAVIVIFILLVRYRNIPDLSSICVIAVGVIGGILLHGIPPTSLIPPPQLVIPPLSAFPSALSTLVLPQVVLTIANAILATSLLTGDLFGKDVPPKKLSASIGLMNIVSVPFGGFPMCHGAGGLAGQYRYGARTGGASIIAGLIFIVLALFFTSPQVLSIVAVGVLGALLIFVGIEMGRYSLKTDSLFVTCLIGVLALLFSMTVAFVIGLIAAYLLVRVKRQPGKKEPAELSVRNDLAESMDSGTVFPQGPGREPEGSEKRSITQRNFLEKVRIPIHRFQKKNDSTAEDFQKRVGHELEIPEKERLSS